ncbi:MAG: TonB family protein, partial [Myxococcales bacterium]|nr:TonB family protein [Myxococcales bacterium]
MRVPFGALCVCALVATAAHAQEAHAPVPPRLVQSNPVVADVAREPVSVVVTLDATGGVTETALVASTGDEALDTRLLEAVRAFVFEPARVDGAAVPARITVQVQIVLPAIESVEAATPEEPAEPSDADPSDADAVAPSEPAPEAAPDAVEPAPEAELDADDEGFGAEARVEAAALRATGRGASDVEISRDVLEAAPAAEGADLLRRAPGVYVARAEGDAVGHRIFLRGFDAEHGQDVELRVAGIPMNLPSHLHGQGYLDLGFLIPEVVDSMRVLEGVADPRQGDFAVAGTVELELGVRRRGLTSRTSGGSFGSFRQLVLWAPEEQRDGSFAAFQMRRTDGFGDNRNALSGSAIVQQVLGDGPWRHRVFVLAHGSRARLAGFLRRDDVQAGRVGFYESYDYPTAEAQSGLA